MTRTCPSLSGWLLIVVSSCLLAACSSSPVQQAEEPAAAKPTAGKSTAAKPAGQTVKVPAQWGGGYYLDDGPHALVPSNLDGLPDAVPRIDPIHPPSLRPYTVMGQRFVPMTTMKPYRERGHASWYGRRFHGNSTAIGEVYDMYEMTAAHPTLPLPSYARVTNIENGRSVIVRVNDRGPFLRGRLIDLSYAAAHRLGYINAGSAEVEVELLTHDAITEMNREHEAQPTSVAQAPALASAGGGAEPGLTAVSPATVKDTPPTGQAAAYLQLGAFETPANAARLMARVREELSLLADQMHLLDQDGRYRLQIGPFASVTEARNTASRISMLLEVQPYLVMR